MEVLFHKPEALKNPMPKFMEMLKTLHNKIGVEQLKMRIESICIDWAMNSGYYFEKDGETFVFVHVSLNKRDFLTN